MQLDMETVYEGTVTGLTNFGAFVKLDNGATGMVHISEVASEYVSDIRERLSEGDKVKVKVIEINEKGKVSLSIKKALPKEEKPQTEKPKPQRKNTDKGWRGAPQAESNAPLTFEDMMAKFKTQSEDKFGDLNRNASKRGTRSNGYRRGNK